MQADEIRFLFAYDRWATRRVLAVLDGLDPAVWTRTHVVDGRIRHAVLLEIFSDDAGVGTLLVP